MTNYIRIFIPMDSRTLWRILRVEGLIPVTGAAILLGFAVTLWETGFNAANAILLTITTTVVFLVYIDADLRNDIMDLEVDRQEKSTETGRDRPLVLGWATVADYRRMSTIVLAVAFVLIAYLTVYRGFMPLLFLIGFLFDYGYNNSPRIAFAYRPFTEWYVYPWLIVAVTVTIAYAGTNRFSLLAFILALLYGMAVGCFGVSMQRRDINSDRLGGKCSSCVRYPELPHSTIYGIVMMVIAFLMVYPLALILHNFPLAYGLCCITVLTAGFLSVIGARIDHLGARALCAVFPEFEARAHRLVLQQVGISLVYLVSICIILVIFSGVT